MKKLVVLLVVGFLFQLTSCGQKSIEQIIEYKKPYQVQIIPKPQERSFHEGYFNIDKKTVIYTSEPAKKEAEFIRDLIESKSNFKIKIKVTDKVAPDTNGNIWILRIGDIPTEEKFQLSIKPNAMLIASVSNHGIMHGIQTLRQLFVDDFHTQTTRANWCLPGIYINDFPIFKHRGLLLDCCRHFFDKEVVKKYIDLLALYKMNVLHWHLTEDQGWRIEIDKYPKLTEIGAWRTEEDGSKYGGFYTKEDIKEIVAYAAKRHITIIPEIELPGHSQAAIASYPHLSCTGKQVNVANDWGVFKEIYCAGNDSVFTFLEDVLTEVMELFPSEYIHIGGDEAPKYRWEHCDKCQARIKAEGLEDEHELQSYFISRIEKFLNENGRKLIGWDEILEGGLAENATVQSWRGIEGGIAAATSGHDAIMSPTSHCYFDYDLKSINLEKVYGFDPIPADLPEDKHHHIIGGECNMWTERVPDEDNLDSKVFPRLLAMSHVLWRYPKGRIYDSFYNYVQYHYPMLKNLGVNYGLETIPVAIEMYHDKRFDKQFIIPLAANEHFEMKHKWICDTCSQTNHQKIDYRILLDRTGTLSLQAYKNGVEYGDPTLQPFSFHKALNKPVSYKGTWNNWYPAGGPTALVNGRLGTLDFRDYNWQGFWGQDFEVVIDLGEEKEINQISTNFYQYNNAWIFLPENVVFEHSLDGGKFIQIADLKRQESLEKRGKFIETFKIIDQDLKARYIKVKATNIKKVPDWHEAAGSEAWLFVDEVIIR